MNDEIEFSVLNHSTDFLETAELIYHTDPYIYKDIFGNLENAKKVLCFSFKNENSVFYKQAIYIGKYKPTDEVVSVVLFHTNDFKWNESVMLSDFAQAGVAVPNSFFAVSEYMAKTYNYRKLGSSMCNVSVKETFRRRGIAYSMLERLLSVTDPDVTELTVLDSNVAAIKLYEKLGFRIVGNAFEDYGGFELSTVKSYKMVRNKPLF